MAQKGNGRWPVDGLGFLVMLFYFDLIVHNEPVSVISADMDNYDSYEHERHIGFCAIENEQALRRLLCDKFVKEFVTLGRNESSIDFVEFQSIKRMPFGIVTIADAPQFLT